MSTSSHVDAFLSAYPEQVQETASAARRLLKDMLPGVAETVDESAKLLGYSYGPGYKGVLFTLIMSQTGVKLGSLSRRGVTGSKTLDGGGGQGSSTRTTAQRRRYQAAGAESVDEGCHLSVEKEESCEGGVNCG